MNLKQIDDVAAKLNIPENALYNYGPYITKVDPNKVQLLHNEKQGNLILVTAMTPTKSGEGKTFTTISLLDGLNAIGCKTIGCLREPSLGPVFGLKGGAVGGGAETIEPAEDINLHFTGDMHALTSAINLISACLDNHIYQGNELDIDVSTITWKRALDMNDRELRTIEIGQGGEKNGVKREDHFQITVASELMAILAICSDENDFKERISNIILAKNKQGQNVYLKDLKIVNAVMKLMKQALKPNLVQTQEGNPCFVHAGPFANIAHGCSSVIATKLALKLGDYVVTEAGFGADLGAEKFLDIKCPESGLIPKLAVLVISLKAIKEHGNGDIKTGILNVERHANNLLKEFGITTFVVLNKFKDDTEVEIAEVQKLLQDKDKFYFYVIDTFTNGSAGALEVANAINNLLITTDKIEDNVKIYHPLYNKEDSIYSKIETISKKIYKAKNIEYSDEARKKLDVIDNSNERNYYVCMAKTPLSFTDDPNIKNAPTDFTIHVKDVSVSNGARFIVVYTGNILTMPGLPKIPKAVLMEDK